MKRIISIVLAMGIVFGMHSTAYAAEKNVITGFSGMMGFVVNGVNVMPGETVDVGDVTFSSVDASFYVTMLKGMFTWSQGLDPSDFTVTLSNGDFRSSKLKAHLYPVKAHDMVAQITEKKANGTVAMNFRPLMSMEPKDFEFVFYLEIDGIKYREEAIRITGRQINDLTTVTGPSALIDTSDGHTSIETLKRTDIEIHAGNGVAIQTYIVPGREYYVYATRPKEEDLALMPSYIVDVVTLLNSGLPRTMQVRLEYGDENLYVYDMAMQYLGTTNDVLPYSLVYNISNKLIETGAAPS